MHDQGDVATQSCHGIDLTHAGNQTLCCNLQQLVGVPIRWIKRSDYAKVMVGRGQRQIAVAYDTRNRNFTESWLNEFRAAVATGGGRVVGEVSYESSPDADFEGVVRKQATQLSIGASEWASTEQLIELGGDVVQGG